MNKKALICDQIYTFLEQLPSLEQEENLALCANDLGEKYVCSEQFWRKCSLMPEQAAPVHSGSTAQEKIEFFLSAFTGRENLYARRYHSVKTGKSGFCIPECKKAQLEAIVRSTSNRAFVANKKTAISGGHCVVCNLERCHSTIKKV